MTSTESNTIAGYYGLKDEEWDAYLSKAVGIIFITDGETEFIDRLFPKLKIEDKIMVVAALKASTMHLMANYGEERILR